MTPAAQYSFIEVSIFEPAREILLLSYCRVTSDESSDELAQMNRLTGAFAARINAQIAGREAQSVTCLTTDARLTADPAVASSIPPRSILSWRSIFGHLFR